MEASGTRRWRRCGRSSGRWRGSRHRPRAGGGGRSRRGGRCRVGFRMRWRCGRGPDEVDVRASSHETGVGGGDEAAEASELDVGRGGMEVDGEVGQRGGEGVAAGGWLGARWLRRGGSWCRLGWCRCGGAGFETEAPLAGPRQPEGEVGIGEREGVRDRAELEVQARAGGLYVWEAGAGPATFGLWARRLPRCARPEEKALQVPAAIGGADEVDAGVGRVTMRENSTRRPQSELMRTFARTRAAQDGPERRRA